MNHLKVDLRILGDARSLDLTSFVTSAVNLIELDPAEVTPVESRLVKHCSWISQSIPAISGVVSIATNLLFNINATEKGSKNPTHFLK